MSEFEYDDDLIDDLRKRFTLPQLLRIFRRAWAGHTEGDGYQPFGYDWTTLVSCRLSRANFFLNLQLAMVRSGMERGSPVRVSRHRIMPPHEFYTGFRPIIRTPTETSLSDSHQTLRTRR